MGNTFPSKKRIPERVRSPAFLIWRDPLFPSEIKGSRQIKNAFPYREKWRARTVGECYPCHETVPIACAPQTSTVLGARRVLRLRRVSAVRRRRMLRHREDLHPVLREYRVR